MVVSALVRNGFAGGAALGLCAVFAMPSAVQAQVVEERYQIESTHTESTQRSAPPPVVVQQSAPPIVVQQQPQPQPPVVVQERTKEVPVPVPQALREGQQVTLSGRIVNIDGDDLILDANGQTVRVDTDDLHMNPVKDPNGPRLTTGDQITVNGKVDDIDHKRVKVNAHSIQVVARNQPAQSVR